MSKKYNVAVVGATGAVGEAMLQQLSLRRFPIDTLFPLASSRSKGKFVDFYEDSIEVQDVAEFDFSQVQIALFSAGGAVSEKYAPIAAKAGAIVIDNTSHFRNEADIPLIVPEVNLPDLANYPNRNIIANPNCSTIQMVVALKPIYDKVGIERINVATYQAVSGSGQSAVQELVTQTSSLLNGRPAERSVYPQEIAFNVLPQIDTFQDNGYTREEMKMVWETRKLLNDDAIQINPTAVRVPVIYGHSEAIHIETKDKITAAEAKALLNEAPGVIVVEDDDDHPTPRMQASGTDDVYVGRIREDISHPRGLDLWVVADNVRKGAATNAVQIAEALVKDYLS